MSFGSDNLSAAIESAKEQDLKPLVEECAEVLALDRDQLATMAGHLDEAWFFGIRIGHKVMVETKLGRTGAEPVILSARGEFQELMEQLADALDATVAATITAWDYLGRAWIAGAKFWEVEIAARSIEEQAGGFEQALRRLWE